MEEKNSKLCLLLKVKTEYVELHKGGTLFLGSFLQWIFGINAQKINNDFVIFVNFGNSQKAVEMLL